MVSEFSPSLHTQREEVAASLGLMSSEVADHFAGVGLVHLDERHVDRTREETFSRASGWRNRALNRLNSAAPFFGAKLFVTSGEYCQPSEDPSFSHRETSQHFQPTAWMVFEFTAAKNWPPWLKRVSRQAWGWTDEMRR